MTNPYVCTIPGRVIHAWVVVVHKSKVSLALRIRSPMQSKNIENLSGARAQCLNTHYGQSLGHAPNSVQERLLFFCVQGKYFLKFGGYLVVCTISSVFPP